MSTGRSVTIRFEGDSGDGIISMGQLTAKVAARMGFHAYTYSTFLAVVRGGQVTFQLRLGNDPLLSQGDDPDILVALNQKALTDHAASVVPGGVILHPRPDGQMPEHSPQVRTVEIQFRERAIDVTGSARGQNVFAAGVVMSMLGFDYEAATQTVQGMFRSKGQEVVDQNIQVLEAGWQEGRALAPLADSLRFEPRERTRRLLLSGNEAVAFGALAAGVRFYAGYPITPASEIMEWLAKYLPQVGGKMIQAEDEIASLGMCIGASYGGVKAMTATSGPGLSLMIELMGLAGMMELPVVIVDVQRAGPSTGMPTKEGQGDLNLAVHGMHGEAPHVVLAPQTVRDCFDQTIRAVNIAHKYQIPVLVLSSQSLSHRMQTIDLPDMSHLDVYEEQFYQPQEGDPPFKRYRMMPDGQPSPRSIPGTPGAMYRAGGLEHDESGNPNFDPPVRSAMVERRRDRMHAIARDFQEGSESETTWGNGTEIGVMSWGSTASTVREVIDRFNAEGIKMACLLPRMLWPLPDKSIRRFLASGIKLLFICELNATRQFAELIRARYTPELIKYDIDVVTVTKDDGLPFSPGEIRQGILQALEQRQLLPCEVRS